MSAMSSAQHDRSWTRPSCQTTEKAILENRSAIQKRKRNIPDKERLIKRREHMIEERKRQIDLYEMMCVDATALFEKEEKESINELNAEKEMITSKSGTIKSVITQSKGNHDKHMKIKNIMSKLMPPDMQQEEEEVEAKVSSDRYDTEGEHSREPQVSPVKPGMESGPGEVPTLQELYFSYPQQLLHVMEELTEQNLSLIQHSASEDETSKELQQEIQAIEDKFKEDEEKLTVLEDDKKDKSEKYRNTVAKLRRMVQLYLCENTEGMAQDAFLNHVCVRVTKLYQWCLGRLTIYDTLTKLSRIEYQMCIFLELIENIPEKNFETLWRIKDDERRSRLREEQLRMDMEKQKERMKKCTQRSLCDYRKISGRKLMPRSIPVERRVTVTKEEDNAAEEELHAYLYSTKDW